MFQRPAFPLIWRHCMRAILAALVLLTIPTADWELLGTRRVNFTGDHDAMIIGAREGGFTALKIDVEGGDLEMYNIKVTFETRQPFPPEPRLLSRQGSWAPPIDPPGPVRLVRRAVF